MMASSRYHGIVTSMPGLVPSAGITMDERIRNLMRERGQEELLMNVDDADLEPRLLAALETLATEGERIADGIGRTVVKNLKVMARMGVYFEEEVQRRYPAFPTRTGEWSWEDYLPPMSENLQGLVKAYA
jgi:polysaccharide pyruvyl transferase WcaK-like protein